jgi:hypothetical protein
MAALVHHVELNRAGWWDRAVEQMILAEVVAAGEPLTLEAIRVDLQERLGRALDRDYLEEQVERLEQDGAIAILPTGGLTASETARRQASEMADEVDNAREAAEKRFSRELTKRSVGGDHHALWEEFDTAVIDTMVAELGARTYQLFAGTSLQSEAEDYLSRFVATVPDEYRSMLRDAAAAFFDPNDLDVRRFILGRLNAQMVLEASGLSREILTQLSSLPSKPERLLLFVDTNVLFSLLDLHANPANEAAHALRALLGQIAEFLRVDLYVLPNTLDEAKGRLGLEMDRMRGVVLTPQVARAARYGEMSGLGQRYVEEISKGSVRMSAEDFFGPYRDNLLTYARAREIELYNVRIEDVLSSQRVIDDTLDREAFEKEKYGDRAKRYEGILHDVAMWHVARGKRPARIDSPLEAGTWVVTADFRLLGMDRHKVRGTQQVPVCIHPAVLTQLLQFWIPRTPEFERAVIASMRLPFLFQEFDPAAERITVKILGALSRFENVDKLPEASIASVLTNQALRSKLEKPSAIEHQINLVESAIVDENVRLQKKAEAEAAKRRDSEAVAKRREAELSARDIQLSELAIDVEERDRRIAQLEARNKREDAENAARQRRRRFVAHVVIPAVLSVVGGGALLSAIGLLFLGMSWSRTMMAAATALSIPALLVLVRTGRGEEHVSSTQLFRAVERVWRVVMAGLAALALLAFDQIIGAPLLDAITHILDR